MRMTRVVGRKAAGHERRLVAGSSHREPPRDSPLPYTLLTLIAPDSMRTTREKGCILGGEHELPKAYGRGLGKWVAEADRNRWRVWIGIAGAVEPESVAEFIGMRSRSRRRADPWLTATIPLRDSRRNWTTVDRTNSRLKAMDRSARWGCRLLRSPQ